MTASLLPGRPLAKALQEKVETEAKALAEEGQRPTLAVVVATEDSSSRWYVRSIQRASQSVGINCRIIDVGPDATEQVLAAALKDLSGEPSVNGIILQTPLPAPGENPRTGPAHLGRKRTLADPLSLGLLAVGQAAFAPATARAVVEMLDYFEIPVAGRAVVVVGRSVVVGKPLALLLLLQKGATITLCHSRSGSLEKYTKNADIVVVAAGRPGLLSGTDVSTQFIVVDVGTHVLPDGSLTGDVDQCW